MQLLDPRLELALEALPHLGCPECGRKPTTIAMDGPGWVACHPCGHSVPYEAVLGV